MKNPITLLRFRSFSKLPVILQSEAAECGLAAIAMVASYYGFKTDLNWLRRLFSLSLKGASLQQLMQVADKLSLTSRALQLGLEDLKNLQKPCILHWDLNHFVVLKKVTSGFVFIHDPAFGEKKLSLQQASKHFTGIALELTPNSQFKPQEAQIKMRLRDFFSRIENLVPSLFKVFLLSLLLQVFALASPYYMQLVVDEVILSQDQHLLLILALGFSLLVLIQLATKALRSLVILHFGNLLNIQMAANLFRHLIHLPLDFFEKRHIGDVVSRFSSLNQVKEILTTGIIETIIDGLMALATLVMIFLYSPKLSAIVVLAVALYALLRLALYRPLRQLSEETIVAKAKEQSNFMESVRGMQSIKLFGREVQRQGLWQNRYAEHVNCSIRLGKYQIHFRWINDLIFGLENVLVIFFAALLVMDSELTVGMLFAFMSYKRQFIEKMVNLIEKIIEFKMLDLHLNRLADIALTKQECFLDSPAEGTLAVSRCSSDCSVGSLGLKDVSFQYSSAEPFLFQQLNLEIRDGESIAIVGSSGCGKTTLLKTMLGLFPATAGKVLYSGIDIQQLGLTNFRQQIAAVMQDDQLLSGSIVDNIGFFSEHIDLGRVEKVAKIAAIDKEIKAMPMGYNTLVGDMGSSLSGGQKQRLLLARALYKQPKVLFLDEATSHLDVNLESIVNQGIKKMSISRIIIAHRIETILSADKIFSLSCGQLTDISETIKQQYNHINGEQRPTYSAKS